MSMLLQVTEATSTKIGSRVDFQTEGGGAWAVWDRFITLDGKRAHFIGNVCGTCPFIFERKEGANDTIFPIFSLISTLVTLSQTTYSSFPATINRLDGGG